MTRADALVRAIELVQQVNIAPKNARGYPADGWRSLTAAELADQALKFAEFLMLDEVAVGEPIKVEDQQCTSVNVCADPISGISVGIQCQFDAGHLQNHQGSRFGEVREWA